MKESPSAIILAADFNKPVIDVMVESASDELRQNVRERLFLGTPDAPPRIASYSGEGDLRHWVRVVAMRAALNLTRGPERVFSDEQALGRLPDVADDP
jgi:hypothetical protein